MKTKIYEVLVVEGKDDTANLRRYYDVETYETKGSAITDEDIERIARLHELYGVIVFTDPDHAGERIRRLIMTAIPTVRHAFLKPSEAQPKSKTKGRSLGVEHASQRDLEEALRHVTQQFEIASDFDITQQDLVNLGLAVADDSRTRRIHLGEVLRIGYANNKQLLKRLRLFGINRQALYAAMASYEKTEKTDD